MKGEIVLNPANKLRWSVVTPDGIYYRGANKRFAASQLAKWRREQRKK